MSGKIGPATISSNYVPFRASTVVNINDQKVLVQECFSWSKRFVLGNSETQAIIVNYAAVDENKIVVVLPVFFQAVGAGPVFIDLYTNPEYTGGLTWEGSNRNNNSIVSPQTVVKYFNAAAYTGNVTSDGDKQPAEFMIPSNGTAAVASFGGQSQESLILIPNKDVEYMFKIVNQEAAAADCVFSLSIFEAVEDV